MLEASLKHTKARQIQSSAFFEDGGMKEVEIITSVHQKHPGEEEGQWKRRGRGKWAVCTYKPLQVRGDVRSEENLLRKISFVL